MKLILVTLSLIFFLGGSFLTAANKKNREYVVHTAYAFMYKIDSVKSKTIKTLTEGDKVWVLAKRGNWVKVKYKGKKGYLHRKAIAKQLQPVNETIYTVVTKSQSDDEIGSTGKGFGESDEIGATGKGFGEADEIGATGKGFGESDEIGATGKGFGESDEIGATGKGFGESDEIGATGKGFGGKRKGSIIHRRLSKQKRLQVIFSKYYASFDEEKYLKREKRLLRKINK